MNSLILNGKKLTNKSNFQSFIKRLKRLSFTNQEKAIKNIFRNHYAKGTRKIFNQLRNEMRGKNYVERFMPPVPRAQIRNIVNSPDGQRSVLVGDTIYTTKNMGETWNYSGGKRKTRKQRKH